jgi:hypothetical protein
MDETAAQAQGTPLEAILPGTDKRRRPGRLPGSPRVPGSGRRAGTPNVLTSDLREVIATKGKPVEFLCKIVQGLRVRVGPQAGPGEPTYVYPSLAQRIEVALALSSKIVSDLRSVEHTGADGEALPGTMIVDARTTNNIAVNGMLYVWSQSNPALATKLLEAKAEGPAP